MKTKDQKFKEAMDRQDKYELLTPMQKLTRLDKKLGKGIGAKKERKRLKSQIKRTPSEGD